MDTELGRGIDVLTCLAHGRGFTNYTLLSRLHLVLVGQGRGALGHVPWLAVVWQQDGILQAVSRVWQCRWVPAAGFVLGVTTEFQARISRPPRNPELLNTFQ